MALILGVDPGSRLTGFGVINVVGARCEYVTSGCIRVGDAEFPERLKRIFDGINAIIREHNPQQMVIEQVFMAKNAGSALKLGQARGAAIVAGVTNGLPVAEYSARQIKQSVVGTGAAQKAQVQHMVTTLLSLSDLPQEDAADALAAALCHAHTQRGLVSLAGVRVGRRGRLQYAR
jgi:crossover junction endodeoxyribonuclease RuvC